MSGFLQQLAVAVPELLAREGRYMEMGRRFRPGSSNFNAANLVTMLAVFAIVAASAWLVARYVKLREKRNSFSPQHLFQELCRAHQLDWPSRKLLQSLAQAHGLADPARIFVEPHRFQLAKLGPGFADCEQQLARLRQQLFAEPDETNLAASD